jgi:hypothetical protein
LINISTSFQFKLKSHLPAYRASKPKPLESINPAIKIGKDLPKEKSYLVSGKINFWQPGEKNRRYLPGFAKRT